MGLKNRKRSRKEYAAFRDWLDSNPGKAFAPHNPHIDLRAGRPDPPEIRGVPCMRCEELTENIACLYQDYWLCPVCAKLHLGIQYLAQLRARKKSQ